MVIKGSNTTMQKFKVANKSYCMSAFNALTNLFNC